MIQSGGWSRLRTADEHTKLARIGLSFSPALDEAFKINVAKMRVQLPASVRDEIARVIVPVVKLAREAYDRKPRSKPGSGSRGKVSEETRVPGGSSSRPDASSRGGEARDRGLLTFDQVADLLREVATESEQTVVESIIRRLRKALRAGQ
jgi:hypothetical protein